VAEEVINKIPQHTSSTPSIFQAMVNFFKEYDLSFQEIEENQALALGFEGKNGKYKSLAIAREEEHQMIFYSVCPLNATKSKLQAIAEFIIKANYGMIIGNFELDFNDGEIRYKTSIDVEGEKLTSVLIKQLVFTNVAMMDKYLPAIRSIIEDNLSPDEAIALVEN
jgi:hypothetical protein